MLTQISREEAAIISAAILAYLGKPTATPLIKISREDIQGILDEFGKELTEKVLREFRYTIKKIEKRLFEVEKMVSFLRSKIVEFEKIVSDKGVLKIEAEKFRFLWGLANRHEIGSQREFIQNLQKSSSFWGLVSKVEKQSSYSYTRGKNLFC